MKQITIIGHLGRNAETGNTNGQHWLRLNVAVSDGYYDQQGQWIDRTDWYSCTRWSDKAPHPGTLSKYLKGSKVLVQGTPSCKLYKRQDGSQGIDQGIRIEKMLMLDKAADAGTQASPAGTWEGAHAPSDNLAATANTTAPPAGADDDLPF